MPKSDTKDLKYKEDVILKGKFQMVQGKPVDIYCELTPKYLIVLNSNQS